MTSVHDQRETLMRTLFARGMPRLSCSLLTHYTEDGGLDKKRIAAHIRHFRPWVPAILAPGSTGDGWEMTPAQTDALLEFLATKPPGRTSPSWPGCCAPNREPCCRPSMRFSIVSQEAKPIRPR